MIFPAMTRNGFLLAAFAIVCTAMVAIVNEMTKPIIAKQEQVALLKTIEAAASRSILGVWIFMPECPDKNPAQSFMSSTAINRIFCFTSVFSLGVLQLKRIIRLKIIYDDGQCNDCQRPTR